MKKKFVYVAMVTLLVMMFAGCQSNEQTENSPTTQESAQNNAESMEAPEMSTALEPTAEPEPTEAPTPEPTPEPEPTSEPEVWGDNMYEAFLPEPPKGYEYYSEDWESMTFAVWDITADELKVWEDYILSLADYGFKLKGDFSHSYTVQDASGNFAVFHYWKEDGALDFSIYIVY